MARAKRSELSDERSVPHLLSLSPASLAMEALGSRALSARRGMELLTACKVLVPGPSQVSRASVTRKPMARAYLALAEVRKLPGCGELAAVAPTRFQAVRSVYMGKLAPATITALRVTAAERSPALRGSATPALSPIAASGSSLWVARPRGVPVNQVAPACTLWAPAVPRLPLSTVQVGVFAVGGNGSFPGVLGVGGQPLVASNSGGPGVHGVGSGSPFDAPNGAFGVYGIGGTDGSPGVRGDGGTDAAAGVIGSSKLGDGISGKSSSGVGVRAFSETSVGLVAQGDTLVPGTIGLVASGNQLAARFDGNVLVQGNFTVTGTKKAAVPFPDGSHRQLYCMESPESWFEDFGFGELVQGQAQVRLDPEFSSVVTSDPYHVFITEYEDNNALYISRRTSEGFVVRAKGSKANGAFSYRLVAKRKDQVAPRFERVSLPK